MMQAQSDNPYAAYFRPIARCGEHLKCVQREVAPRVGMSVRDPHDEWVGVVVGVVVGESGAVVALDVAIGLKRERKRVPIEAMRSYADALVSLYYRREFGALPPA